jgi:hypothetical protein
MKDSEELGGRGVILAQTGVRYNETHRHSTHQSRDIFQWETARNEHCMALHSARLKQKTSEEQIPLMNPWIPKCQLLQGGFNNMTDQRKMRAVN